MEYGLRNAKDWFKSTLFFVVIHLLDQICYLWFYCSLLLIGAIFGGRNHELLRDVNILEVNCEILLMYVTTSAFSSSDRQRCFQAVGTEPFAEKATLW